METKAHDKDGVSPRLVPVSPRLVSVSPRLVPRAPRHAHGL